MKQKIILLGRDGRPSIRQVAAIMAEELNSKSDAKVIIKRRPPTGKPYFREFELASCKDPKGYSKIKEENFTSIEDSIVVRWGNRTEFTTNKSTVVYNKASSIELATNKKKSRITMEANGVPIPRLIRGYDPNITVIARPSVHAKGVNFVVLKEHDEFIDHFNRNERNGWYYSEYIDKDSEYRLHCGHGKVLAIMEKPKPSNGSLAWNRARNSSHDEFQYVNWNRANEAPLKNSCIAALSAVKSLGLDMGGVDVICKGDNAYVLEINTCPTLISSPYVSKRWAMYFDWLFRSESRRPHFDILPESKGKSFIWKNYELLDKEKPNNKN